MYPIGSDSFARSSKFRLMFELGLKRPVRLFAPAKVNLSLEVVGRRPDGYHEIVTIMQTVSLFDEIELSPSDTLEFAGDQRIPDRTDLAYRAIQLAHERLGIQLNAKVKMKKRIPIAAGFGGGSSDAATLLAAICTMARVDLTDAQALAAELGSDVPFFIRGGSSLATGTGTRIEPLPALSRTWFVLVTPNVRIPSKTAAAYSSLEAEDFSDGAATREIAAGLKTDMPINPDLMRNAFARSIYRVPEVDRAREVMLEAGARVVLPCGAGPSLFATADTWDQSRDVAQKLRSVGLAAVAVTNTAADINADRLRSLRD